MKILLFDFNNILADVKEELVRRGHKFIPNWEEADVIVVWQENEEGGWKEMVRKWQKAGKRVVLVQHGRLGTSRTFPPFNEKLLSDAICVWGQNDIDRLSECGVPKEKMTITGTTVLRHLIPRVPHKGINVVFSPEHWDHDVIENAIVMGALNKVENINITTKILKGEHNPSHYVNAVASRRGEEGHLETCAEVLSQADVVVALSESTFELMAQILDIPVIIADIWVPKACAGDDRYKEYHRIYSDAVTKVADLSNLEHEINSAVFAPDRLSEERKNIAVLDGGMHIKDPLDSIIKVILD